MSYTAKHCGAEFAITQPNLDVVVSAALPAARQIWIVAEDGSSPQPEKSRRFETLLRGTSSVSPTCSALSAAFVQYTSGTTGRPKGVIFTHSNALWAGKVSATHEGLTACDVHLVYLPLFHINALGYSVLASLWAGASFVLQPRFSASRFWEVSVRTSARGHRRSASRSMFSPLARYRRIIFACGELESAVTRSRRTSACR